MFFFFSNCKSRFLFGFCCIVVWFLLQHCYWTLFSALFILSHDFLMLLFIFLVTIQLMFHSSLFFVIGLLLLLVNSSYWCSTPLVVILFPLLLIDFSFCGAIHFFLCYSFPLVADWLFFCCVVQLLLLFGSFYYYLVLLVAIWLFFYVGWFLLLMFNSFLIVVHLFSSCCDVLFQLLLFGSSFIIV